jgi:hypothetical protein
VNLQSLLTDQSGAAKSASELRGLRIVRGGEWAGAIAAAGAPDEARAGPAAEVRKP